MFLRNILFVHLALLQTVFSSQNDNLQYLTVSTYENPSNPYEESNALNSEFDFEKFISAKLESLLQDQFKHQNEVANEMKNQIGELGKEISGLKNEQQTVLNEQKNNFDRIQNQLQKLEQKQEEHLKVLNEFAKYKNLSEEPKTNPEIYLTKPLSNRRDLMLPKNCRDVQRKGISISGVYTIWPIDAPEKFDVWCDMETQGGGWAYAINRYDGSLNFDVKWAQYKNGFGNLNGEHWLGLEHLYFLTKGEFSELLIELVNFNLTKAYAHYEKFSIGNEDEAYPIKILKGYSGNAGDDFSYHLGLTFTTSDNDHGHKNSFCASSFGGGFWYKSCHSCLFTGTYNLPYGGILYPSFGGPKDNLKEVRMMIRS